MKIKQFLTLVGLLLFAAKINAQTPTNFSASHLKASENMLLATGIDKSMATMTANVVDAFSNNVPEQNRAQFKTVLNNFFKKYLNWESVKDDFKRIYAEEFSEEELNQLVKFYNTPLGKKVNEKMPILQQKGMQLGQKIVQDHQEELQAEIQKNFKKPE